MTVPAPVGELPLFARAGALLGLLPPEVDTLADVPGAARSLVRLRDRRDRLEVLAFPRGRSSGRFDADGRLTSSEGRGRWTLRLEARRPRTVVLRASLLTLERPFRPRSVEVGGRRLRRGAWRYDDRTGVLRAAFRGRRAVVVVR